MRLSSTLDNVAHCCLANHRRRNEETPHRRQDFGPARQACCTNCTRRRHSSSNSTTGGHETTGPTCRAPATAPGPWQSPEQLPVLRPMYSQALEAEMHLPQPPVRTARSAFYLRRPTSTNERNLGARTGGSASQVVQKTNSPTCEPADRSQADISSQGRAFSDTAPRCQHPCSAQSPTWPDARRARQWPCHCN